MGTGTRREAYRWAIRALARRMRSAHEVKTGLHQKAFPHEVIADVVSDLAEKGYLDDEKFASNWVESRSANRGYGRIRLSFELRKKGVSEEIADRVLSLHLPPANEAKIARTILEKKLRGLGRAEARKQKGSLLRFLRGRGFSSEAIWTALGDSDKEERA